MVNKRKYSYANKRRVKSRTTNHVYANPRADIPPTTLLVRSPKPEIKYKDTFHDNVTSTAIGILPMHITNIANGAFNGQRVGRSIHVVKIQARGTAGTAVASAPISLYLLHCRMTTPPTTVDFPNQGEYMDPVRYRELLHFNGWTFQNHCDLTYIPKSPLKIGYTASGAPENPLYFVQLNKTLDVPNVRMAFRIWYYDA